MTTAPTSAPALAEKPWALIAIPLAIVACIAFLVLLLYARRRRRYKSRLRVSSDPRARQALERDLQEAWVRGARPPQPQPQPQPQLSRHGATRWAWAHSVLQARPLEGLNELGEAPPPYDARERAGGAAAKLGDDGEAPPAAVELRVLDGPGPPSSLVARTPPSSPPPPVYTESQAGVSVPLPPAAVLRSPR